MTVPAHRGIIMLDNRDAQYPVTTGEPIARHCSHAPTVNDSAHVSTHARTCGHGAHLSTLGAMPTWAHCMHMQASACMWARLCTRAYNRAQVRPVWTMVASVRNVHVPDHTVRAGTRGESRGIIHADYRRIPSNRSACRPSRHRRSTVMLIVWCMSVPRWFPPW